MRGASLLIEFHSFRGIGLVGGPLGRVLVLGFVSFKYAPWLITEWIKRAIDKLK